MYNYCLIPYYYQKAMIDLTESAESGSDSDTVIRRTTKKADDILNFLVSSVVPICACIALV